jgi:hypothetical protein
MYELSIHNEIMYFGCMHILFYVEIIHLIKVII